VTKELTSEDIHRMVGELAFEMNVPDKPQRLYRVACWISC
jgi:hypothetical protein